MQCSLDDFILIAELIKGQSNPWSKLIFMKKQKDEILSLCVQVVHRYTTDTFLIQQSWRAHTYTYTGSDSIQTFTRLLNKIGFFFNFSTGSW